jgi:regulator of nonsense transcripts 3
MPPKIIAKNADRQGGVLPVTGAARAATSKAPAAKLKLEVRRLPPGLTIEEFEEALGEEWKLGSGRVDWRDYRQGKVRPAGSGKPPQQSRCYLHLVSEPFVKEFEAKFLDSKFDDKAGTHKNPDLRHLQPTVGYAPNQRTPLQQAKRRVDNRQGTIDQDPEFIAFLEAETQPITKQPPLDSVSYEGSAEKSDVRTTPLIEDLREKKANKAKAAQAKAEKAAEKDKKAQAAKSTTKDANAGIEKDGGKTLQQQKAEPAAKGGKAQAKQAGPKQKEFQPEKIASPAKTRKPLPSPKPQAASSSPASATRNSSSPAPHRTPAAQRQRGNADGIKKMLQKDLGIKPKPPTLADATGSSSTAQIPASPAASTQPTPITATSTTPKSPPTKPAAVVASQSEAKPAPLKAYLKHANPSQGMTEILIQQALTQYGELSNVTIDPRKGTAIAVFKENEGLKKALEAKKVPVAGGAVEVLEFRDRAAGGPAGRGGYRGGRGGRGGARGGGNAQSTAPASPAPT